MSPFKNKLFYMLMALLMCGFSLLSSAGKLPPRKSPTIDPYLQKDRILDIMQRVADWQLDAWTNTGFKHAKVDWTNAACYTGLYALGSMPHNEKYITFLVDIGNSLNWNTGRDRYMADDYCIGQTYSLLYAKYKDAKMIAPFRELADSIVSKPHTESLEWKNRIQSREWAWCDALFMGPTALSYLSTATGDPKYLETAIKLWYKTTDYLYDPKAHLYSRDGSFLEKKENNGEKVFWSRGNGWVMGGLVRVLDNMPLDHPERKRFEAQYKEMVMTIASLQQPDGSWHASLLDPASYPVKETSGTGFYTYALLWGLNHNLIDQKIYWPIAKKAWQALTSSVQKDGMLGYVQRIGAAPDSVDETSTEVYGVGAFLLAGTQMYQFIDTHPKAK